jgi:cysteine-rich repeat protein
MLSFAKAGPLLVTLALFAVVRPAPAAQEEALSCGVAFSRIEGQFARAAFRFASIACAHPERLQARAAELVRATNQRIAAFNGRYAGQGCDPDVPLPVAQKTTADVMSLLQSYIRSAPLDRFCNGDDDPDLLCGNGQEDPGEACDGGDLGEQTCASLGSGSGTLACRPDCQGFDFSGCSGPAYCGNGVMDAEHGEACDAGGQTATCDLDCTAPLCGDGLLNALRGEQCDDGAANSNAPNVACRGDCQLARCGDGVTDWARAEGCDAGGNNSNAPNATCRTNCQPRRCGDGVTDNATGESCDDGNHVSGDNCSADCRSTEMCGNSIVDVARGEECDAGSQNANIPNAPCRPSCLEPRCGDGVPDAVRGEACDFGAANSNQPNAVCRANCQPRRCGDAVVDTMAGEVCDDGFNVSGDNCSADCLSNETCGNGIIDVAKGERCDDGNVMGGDGCSSACQSED